MKNSAQKIILMSVVLMLSFSGCQILAPVIDSVHKAGMMNSDRQALLYTELQHFHNARYWASIEKVTGFLHPESSPELVKVVTPKKKEERITDSEVEAVTFSEDAFEADVDVNVKAYKLTTYIVQERKEHQVWKFSLGSGWKLLSVDSPA